METELLTTVEEILLASPRIKQQEHPRIVIFSDLHMGNGKRSDDFRTNAPMFQTILEQHYFHRDYSLILNGDIEELQKFRLEEIQSTYPELFELFGHWNQGGKLFKTIGNHDEALWELAGDYTLPKAQAYRIVTPYGEIDLLHGHQFGALFAKHNRFVGWILRYLAKPLGIRNQYIAHDSPKRYHLENRAYQFARSRSRFLVMGHTHRPVFETLSKRESLQYTIERLLSELSETTGPERRNKEKQIGDFLREYRRLEKKKTGLPLNRIYSDELLIPNLFNSGCAIGHRGMTALEIEANEIRLVHWYDSTRGKTRISNTLGDPLPLGETGYYRRVLRADELRNVFDRIRLLSGE